MKSAAASVLRIMFPVRILTPVPKTSPLVCQSFDDVFYLPSLSFWGLTPSLCVCGLHVGGPVNFPPQAMSHTTMATCLWIQHSICRPAQLFVRRSALHVCWASRACALCAVYSECVRARPRVSSVSHILLFSVVKINGQQFDLTLSVSIVSAHAHASISLVKDAQRSGGCLARCGDPWRMNGDSTATASKQ